MHPDDDLQTTLSKWPFILGDVLLVGTGLAIAILGNWQLTDWQVGACVAAVALGAALFVLPYVVEYQVRVREDREDREADLRILEKHLIAAEQSIGEIEERIKELELTHAESGEPNSILAEAFDQKFALLEKQCLAQNEAIAALQKLVEESPEEQPAAFDPAVLKPLEDRLEALENRPQSPVVEPVEPVENEPEPEAPKADPASAAKKTKDQIERPKRSARERHGPEESRLIKRAISENGDRSSTAVSRIIGSKAKEKAEEKAETKEATGVEVEAESAPEVSNSEEPKEPQVEKATASPQEEVSEEETEKATEPEISDQAAPENKEAVKEQTTKEEKQPKAKEGTPRQKEKKPPASKEGAPEPDRTDDAPEKAEKSEESSKGKAEAVTARSESDDKEESDDAPDDVTTPATTDMLFDEEKVSPTITKKRAKKNDAVLTASVFIGIGNKPYLRGDGGGLNWEKGVLMEFQEIGKWRWVAPSDLESEIEIQLYRNDEDPDTSGTYKLKPGQKLEVNPVF